MADVLIIKKINDVYVKLIGEDHLIRQIADHFTFFVPGYKHNPLYKNRVWDGKIRLVNYGTKMVFYGLISEIKELGQKHDFEVELHFDYSENEISEVEAKEFFKTLNLPFQPRDYQIKAFLYAIRNKRGIIISPTASGKTFIAYLIIRYLAMKDKDFKTLVIVPNIGLVKQMKKDFVDYGWYESCIYGIKAGVDKNVPVGVKVVVSTWHSAYVQSQGWLSQFTFILVDEAHEAKSNSIQTLMKNAPKCEYRFGMTGSLDGLKTNLMVLQGLFGSVYKVITTKELMDRKEVAELKIKIINLSYCEALREQNYKMDYPKEIKFLTSLGIRNNFIKNLALSLDNNVLIMTNRVDGHGRILYDLIKEKNEETYLIYADTEDEERMRITELLETKQGVKIVGSHRCIGTGTNYKNLHNIIYAYPTKSVTQVLQSIGRGLRLHESKEHCTLYDISDDMSFEGHKNHTLRHAIERVKHYKNEKFNYKAYNVKIGDTNV